MESIEFKIKNALNNHGVIAFPTETVMGLGVYFDDEIALSKLNMVKGRPENKPYTLMLSSVDEIAQYAKISEKSYRIIRKFMTGPLTVLIPIKENLPYWLDYGSGKIGIRVPSYEPTLKVLKAAKKGLLVPSANISGNPPALTSDEAKKIFGNSIDLIIEGSSNSGIPSTIVDLTDKDIKIIREGTITKEDILKALEE